MDAIHYDKIADKLVNFHSKLPNTVNLELISAKNHVIKLKEQIAQLLYDLDVYADLDDKGWIR